MTDSRGKDETGAGDGGAKGSRAEAGARAAALRALLRIEGQGSFIGLEGGEPEGGRRLRRQATEYVAGITRWRRRLDFLLASAYHGDFGKMELPLKIILRIGLYDLLYLHTPTYAAVNEAVALAKKEVRRGAGGLVNGILRTLDRTREDLPEPRSGDHADDLAVTHSHPTWMVRRWLERYGRADTEALLTWNNARPTYGVRVNTLRISTDDFTGRLDAVGAEWSASAVLTYFLRMPTVQPLLEHGLLDEGFCAVQDESAGLIVRLLGPSAGERVVDLCAAPGGKALHAAQLMHNEGLVCAVDVHERRLQLVEHTAADQEASIVQTVTSDARHFDGEWVGQADRVLIDAPCSGFGVLAKRADLRWRRSPEDLEDLTRLQDEILDNAARLVRPAGLLVYGTCTIEPEENAERVEAFLARHPEFVVEDAADHVPAGMVTPEGYYASFPPRDGMDGAFGARLRRRSG